MNKVTVLAREFRLGVLPIFPSVKIIYQVCTAVTDRC